MWTCTAALLLLASPVWSEQVEKKQPPKKAPAPVQDIRLGYHRSPWFREQVREQWIEGDVRVVVNLPAEMDPTKPTQLVVFATPNGNSIEYTLGCAKAEGLDWHFDIQHVAAQIRYVREMQPGKNIVLACIEAEGLSWPGWRRRHDDAPPKARRVVDWIREAVGSPVDRIVLTGHSGGGSFVFSYIDGADAIPDDVERISFLDSNYSYADQSKHGDKLIAWLRGNDQRRLTVIAYDDREIMLNGKKVVSPTGGTFRATEKMVTRFRQDMPLTNSKIGEFNVSTGLNGQVNFYVHPNPQNKILHTILVGDMNGVIRVLSDNATLGQPREYSKWIQPAPTIPPRPSNSLSGKAFFEKIAGLPRLEREFAIVQEVLSGNVPDFLREFTKVTITGKDGAGPERTAIIEVMPDYLAIGSNADFVRIPMNSYCAQSIADAWGCSLPTRKIVNEVHRQSGVKLSPIPLTKDRDAMMTFLHHHELIEKQRAKKELGELVSGIKKDVVVTNRLGERPNRGAIFGWHKSDGNPIQPLNISHVNWYVDYSHGIRLIKRNVLVDGKPRDIRHAMHDAGVCYLLSDEGPIMFPSY